MRYTISSEPSAIQWERKGEPWRTLQNAKNLLMTIQGEVPFDRYRGLDSAVHDRNYLEVQSLIFGEIQRMMLWEPDVTVKAVRYELRDGQPAEKPRSGLIDEAPDPIGRGPYAYIEVDLEITEQSEAIQ